MTDTDAQWKPPFSSDDTDLMCPVCGASEGSPVQVRAKLFYYSGDEAEAYCSACHADLYLQVSIEVVFSDPEVVE